MNKYLSLFLIIPIVMFGYTIYQWLNNSTVDLASLLFGSFILSIILGYSNKITSDSNSNQDELSDYIKNYSSRLSYYILMAFGFIILFFSEGTGSLENLTNIPLVILLCLFVITKPTVEFFLF